MPTERDELIRDIDGLKERIRLAWMDMVSKPMTALPVAYNRGSRRRRRFRFSINRRR